MISKGYLPILTSIYKNDDQLIKKEAVWAICNFTLAENKYLIKLNFDNNILETICHILKSNDSKFVAVAIESLGNLLEKGQLFANNDGSNPVVLKLEELNMFDVLENLQRNPIQLVYKKTLAILEKYFPLD